MVAVQRGRGLFDSAQAYHGCGPGQARRRQGRGLGTADLATVPQRTDPPTQAAHSGRLLLELR